MFSSMVLLHGRWSNFKRTYRLCIACIGYGTNLLANFHMDIMRQWAVLKKLNINQHFVFMQDCSESKKSKNLLPYQRSQFIVNKDFSKYVETLASYWQSISMFSFVPVQWRLSSWIWISRYVYVVWMVWSPSKSIPFQSASYMAQSRMYA